MNDSSLLLASSWTCTPQKEIAQENDHSSLTALRYPSVIPLDPSLPMPLPPVEMKTHTSNSITISRSPLSSLSGEKSFDPFGSTYFSNLIPTVITSTIPSKDQPPSNVDFLSTSPSTACNSYGDLFDDQEDDICHYFLHNLIDLDLLDDYAINSVAVHSDCEPCADGSNYAINHESLHLPFLLNSPTPPCSSSYSSTTSSPMMNNIWANTYCRYQNPFDDDEFDPTQPSPSSSSTSYSSSPTAVDMLMTMLPHYTQEQVVSTLCVANYDIDQFLALLSSDGRSSTSYTKKRQICRHYLSGDCLRQDCRFAHDITIKICRFWLQDKCLKGNQCEFAHSMESICIEKSSRRRRHKKIKKTPNVTMPFVDEDFPALPLKPVSVNPISTNFAQVVATRKK